MASYEDLGEKQANRVFDELARTADLNCGILSSRVHMGQKILVLDATSMPLSDTDMLDRYALHAKNNNDINLPSNCRSVAHNALYSVRGGGILHGYELKDFTGYFNHWMNWDFSPDGTHVAIDLTAVHSLDHNQGSFNMLVMRAMGRAPLRELVADFYGGHWKLH